MEGLVQRKAREYIKKEIERKGLVCDCGEKVYTVGTGVIESQPTYNIYSEYLECFRCRKVYYL